MNGMDKPNLSDLTRVQDRITFLYLEKCAINRDSNAITVTDKSGIVHIPAASISVLLLGPGTDITHRAMELIGDTCISVVWVGERGVRYYAAGRPMARSTALLIRQAMLVNNVRQHAEVVRRMYSMRFPNEDVSNLTIQQLRGREGSRVRSVYREMSQRWNVTWNGRDYDPDNYEAGDDVNKALSAGNSCLYGLALAVITALGCSPGLGFVHVGHEFSFAYDIADLYKAEVTIPLAFEMAANPPKGDLGAAVRRKVRDIMVSRHILERMVHDVQALLSVTQESEDAVDALYLWDSRKSAVPAGRMYGEEAPEDSTCGGEADGDGESG